MSPSPFFSSVSLCMLIAMLPLLSDFFFFLQVFNLLLLKEERGSKLFQQFKKLKSFEFQTYM